MSQFSLRDAVEADMPYLHAFNASEGMGFLDSLDGLTVAVDSDDDPIGYIRISIGESGQAYINPIVVNPLWRREGVGKALVESALRDHASLRLVSRGPAVPFYRSLGFKECDWSQIEAGCAEDCEDCPSREECSPLPMELVRGRA